MKKIIMSIIVTLSIVLGMMYASMDVSAMNAMNATNAVVAYFAANASAKGCHVYQGESSSAGDADILIVDPNELNVPMLVEIDPAAGYDYDNAGSPEITLTIYDGVIVSKNSINPSDFMDSEMDLTVYSSMMEQAAQDIIVCGSSYSATASFDTISKYGVDALNWQGGNPKDIVYQTKDGHWIVNSIFYPSQYWYSPL